MLFNSPAFIFVFLPASFAGFFFLGHRAYRGLAAMWLVGVSFLFYSWWNPAFLPLLAASISLNYLAGYLIAGSLENKDPAVARMTLVAGVTTNLLLLGYYKYSVFLLANLARLLGAEWDLESLSLPLGISFFTFTQIAYLVDVYKGKAREYNPVHYALFVSYFPHLIAGPILHHREMMPQFQDINTYRINYSDISVGLTIFSIGLFKKVMLADSIAPYANAAFDAAARGAELSVLEAWGGALIYTLQLYFDFSGYSDMAIGASRIFGIRLPINFHSPYKALCIIDFWRRWHMTLSRFLRDYLYIPLGGNRKGVPRRFVNLLTTMLLGGLWHGAGWTYIAWGALHGAYLCINYGWLEWKPTIRRFVEMPFWISRPCARVITLVAVVVGWVVFRADSLGTATQILGGMFGMNGFVVPDTWIAAMGQLGGLLVRVGIASADVSATFGGRQTAWIIFLIAIVWFAPNTQQILSRFNPGIAPYSGGVDSEPRLCWQPNWQWSLVIGLLAVSALLHLNRATDFLYWQF